jgi:hypothetical protein
MTSRTAASLESEQGAIAAATNVGCVDVDGENPCGEANFGGVLAFCCA